MLDLEAYFRGTDRQPTASEFQAVLETVQVCEPKIQAVTGEVADACRKVLSVDGRFAEELRAASSDLDTARAKIAEARKYGRVSESLWFEKKRANRRWSRVNADRHRQMYACLAEYKCKIAAARKKLLKLAKQ